MDYKGVSKGTKELFEIADYDPNRDRYLVGNFTASDLSKTVYLPVSNVTEQTIQLKRGEILAEVSILEETTSDDSLIKVASCLRNDMNLNDLHLPDLSETERSQLLRIYGNPLRHILSIFQISSLLVIFFITKYIFSES